MSSISERVKKLDKIKTINVQKKYVASFEKNSKKLLEINENLRLGN